MSKLVKEVTFGDDLHIKIASGLKKVYDVAKESYGPNAGNALIEYPYGDPHISRDGVNNIRKLRFQDAIENATAAIVTQASSQNDIQVGDGTTLSAVLTYHLYTKGWRLVAGGENQMVVSRRIIESAATVVSELDKLKQPIKADLLAKVAATSAGEVGLGEMIADTVNKVGADGGIVVEDFAGRGVYNEIMEGFYFRQGLVSAYLAKDSGAMESKHTKVPILILDKQLSDANEAAELMERILAKFKELIIIGSVVGEALALIIQLRMEKKIIVSIVDAPYEARALFLEDVALMTDATLLTEGFDINNFTLAMLGMTRKAVITTTGTTLLGSDGAKEKIQERVEELQKQLKDSSSPVDIEHIRARLSRLTGKVAIVRVGGANQVDQQEVKLRVWDAIGATQAAAKDGILPGGGSILARIETDFKEAYEEPFKQLALNNGSNPEKLLFKVQAAKMGYGFNFRELTEDPINLVEAGVVDAALVIKQAVTNAAAVAAKLLTTSSAITLADRSEKHD